MAPTLARSWCPFSLSERTKLELRVRGPPHSNALFSTKRKPALAPCCLTWWNLRGLPGLVVDAPFVWRLASIRAHDRIDTSFTPRGRIRHGVAHALSLEVR